jgi:alcohol dehydrogenase class IV
MDALKQYTFNPPLSRLSLNFDQPRRIIFGPNSSDQTGREAKRLGGGRVLILTDVNVRKAGLSSRVQESIEKEGCRTEVYDKIAFEPTIQSVEAAVGAARDSSGYDVVVAVGGGSVMDTAKMVANMLTNPGEPASYLTPAEDRFTRPSAPKILIPTTAGTGSEVSNYSVVIEKETMYKTWAASSNLLAEVALIDPTLMLTCPPRVTAGCSLDVAGHNIEGLISRESTPISDALATEAVKLLFRHARRAYHNPDDLEARSGMAMAAMFGGMVIAYPWIGGPAILGHCLAEAFGPKYGVPHGIAVGIALPYILEFNMPACAEKVYSFASALGIGPADRGHDGSSVRATAERVPKAVLQLMKDTDLPRTLKQVGFPEADIQPFAEYIVNDRQYVYNLARYNPRRLTVENTVQLLQDMYDGALED